MQVLAQVRKYESAQVRRCVSAQVLAQVHKALSAQVRNCELRKCVSAQILAQVQLFYLVLLYCDKHIENGTDQIQMAVA